ncbi:YhaN family protein [Marinibacterium profundimaris]|uniref:YhaN AAA domain-containing protein n=1 Tax=Marinibacterium profundimaris TaxID=1679460 RepID=A0A225NQ33_9RHOB|nr:YhaN family protein [Marinibacterium profundimaris]OWU74642.1 hypothetical protein ATO3_08395 [Marinibacterium profundimaris]
MRLRRLDLTRYGRFTDHAIDFGTATPGRPDLHVIFGPNEAGKTTCFEAYLDLLYGIPMRSPYNFLHDYDSMEVGGLLEIDGTPTALRRIKRQRNDLLDADGQPVGPALLSGALGGIGRDQYRAMFSLDDDTIEAGGEDILASQGSLGELLFSAAAGLSDLGAELKTMREEAEAFHKPRGRKTELAEAKRALKELQGQLREIDLSASRYRQLKAADTAARSREAEARARRETLQRELNRARAIARCLPLRAEHDALQGRLAPIADWPAVPAHWQAEAETLRDAEVEARTRLSGATDAIARLETEGDTPPRDPLALTHAEALGQLMDKPRARALSAEGDLPSRRASLSELAGEIRALHRDLSLPDETLPPPSPALATAETAARALQEAERAATRAAQDLAEADAALVKATEAAPDTSDTPDPDLATLLEELEPETLAGDVSRARAAQAEAQADLAASRAALTPWTGPEDTLPPLLLSRDQLARRLDRWSDALRTLDRAEERRAEAQVSRDQAQARCTALEADASLVTDAQAEAARAARDTSWTRHSAALTSETAALFHAEMLRLDSLQEARLGMAEQLGRLRDGRLATIDAQTLLEARISEHARAEEIHDTLLQDFRDLCSRFGLPELDPADLTAWLDHLHRAHEAQARLARAGQTLAEAQAAQSAAAARMCAALGLSEADGTPFATLTARARAEQLRRAEMAARIAEHRKALDTARQSRETRTRALDQTRTALDTASADWSRARTALPETLHDAAAFLTALPALRTLLETRTERDRLASRIAAMEADQAGFATSVARMAAALQEPERETPGATAAALRARLATAQEAETRHADRQARLAELRQAEQEARSRLSDIAADIADKARALPQPQAIASAGDLLSALSTAAQAETLRHEIDRLRQEILPALGAEDMAAAAEILDAADLPEVEARCAGLDGDLATAQTELEDAIGEARLTAGALQALGGDDAAARLAEQQATLLVDLSDKARRHLRLQIGLAAAEQALARYRDSHRSAMLSATADAFRTLTAGAYTDLQTRTAGEAETLLAIRGRDNRSVAASEMSKGTRFQLYLALRLAGYRDYSARGVALPFVADDIMETFDNTRTSAALGLLRELGRQGQALYFTHHEHVVELAREICGDDLNVHDISPG